MDGNYGCVEMAACLQRVLGEAARLHETTQCLSEAPHEFAELGHGDQANLERATDYVACTVDQIIARLTRVRSTMTRISDCGTSGRLSFLLPVEGD